MTALKKINKRFAGLSFVLAVMTLLQAAVPLATLAAETITMLVWVEDYYVEMPPYAPILVPAHAEYVELDLSDRAKNGDTKDPIDTASGNNHFMEEHLSVPCPGIPLDFNLEYSSLPGERPSGVFGTNWTHSYEWTLYFDTNQTPDQVTLYTGTEGPVTFAPVNSNGLFQAAARNWSMETGTNGYAVHLPAGLNYFFNTTGRLDRIQDAWGNQVVCSYGTNGCLESVTHSNRRSLVFSNHWDSVAGAWRLGSVAVEDGASLSFAYGAEGQFTQIVEQVDVNSYISTYRYGDGFLTNKVNGAGFNYIFNYEETNGMLTGKGTHLSVDGFSNHDLAYVSNNVTDVTYHERGLDQVYRYVRNANSRLEAQYGPAATGNVTGSLV